MLKNKKVKKMLQRSDLFTVYARTRGKNYLGEDSDQITAFLVEKSWPGEWKGEVGVAELGI